MKKTLKCIAIFFAIVIFFSGCAKKPLKNASGPTKNMTLKEILEYNKIYEGVQIDGESFSDKTKDEVIKYLKDKYKDKNKIIFKYNEFKKEINLSDIGISYNLDEAANMAFLVGRTGTDDSKIAVLQNILTTPKNITIPKTRNEEKVNMLISEIKKSVEVEPVNERISFKDGKVSVITGKDGVKIDEEKLKEALYNTTQMEINIPVSVKAAKKVDSNMVKSINGVIGESSTNFSSSQHGRNFNIALASKRINEFLIMPGETFSFLNNIGSLTHEGGYKIATAFNSGKVVEAVGGGVCQVSTTLYQAALKANLQIVERKQHSMRIGYTGLGLDAMVYAGSSDLKFKNNFDFPVVITSYVTNGTVGFRILGDTSKKNYTVKIFTGEVSRINRKVEKISDPNLLEGKTEVIQEGRDGYTGYSCIQIGNSPVKVLNKDYFSPEKKIIKVGTKVIPKPEKPESQKEPKN